MEESKRKMIGLNIALILIVLALFGLLPFASDNNQATADLTRSSVASTR